MDHYKPPRSATEIKNTMSASGITYIYKYHSHLSSW